MLEKIFSSLHSSVLGIAIKIHHFLHSRFSREVSELYRIRYLLAQNLHGRSGRSQSIERTMQSRQHVYNVTFSFIALSSRGKP